MTIKPTDKPFDINEIREWVKPDGSWSVCAWTTYKSELFDFRTGEYISILTAQDVRNMDSFYIIGRHENITTDEQCFQILLKIGPQGTIKKIIEHREERAIISGANALRGEIKNLLATEY